MAEHDQHHQEAVRTLFLGRQEAFHPSARSGGAARIAARLCNV